jgi:hypothetical protein
MGGKNSKDLGYDWWKLVQCKEWESLQSLIDNRPATCLQKDCSGDLLLQGLCKCEDLPLYVLEAVISAHMEVTTMPSSAGLLPLHVACQRQGKVKTTTEMIRLLVEAGPGACKVGSVQQNNLPLHELLIRGCEDLGINLLGVLMVNAYTAATKETNNANMLPLQLAVSRKDCPDSFLLVLLNQRIR